MFSYDIIRLGMLLDYYSICNIFCLQACDSNLQLLLKQLIFSRYSVNLLKYLSKTIRNVQFLRHNCLASSYSAMGLGG